MRMCRFDWFWRTCGLSIHASSGTACTLSWWGRSETWSWNRVCNCSQWNSWSGGVPTSSKHKSRKARKKNLRKSQHYDSGHVPRSQHLDAHRPIWHAFNEQSTVALGFKPLLHVACYKQQTSGCVTFLPVVCCTVGGTFLSHGAICWPWAAIR